MKYFLAYLGSIVKTTIVLYCLVKSYVVQECVETVCWKKKLPTFSSSVLFRKKRVKHIDWYLFTPWSQIYLCFTLVLQVQFCASTKCTFEIQDGILYLKRWGSPGYWFWFLQPTKFRSYRNWDKIFKTCLQKITAVFYSQVVWFAFSLHWRQQHGPVTETAVAGEVMECSCNKAPSVATERLLQMWILILIF